VHGQAPTHGIREHIQAMRAFVESTGGAPIQVKSHPIRFGSEDWTCVVGEPEDDSRMVTVAKWRDGAIAEDTSGSSRRNIERSKRVMNISLSDARPSWTERSRTPVRWVCQ
jgi:hypothetical protein